MDGPTGPVTLPPSQPSLDALQLDAAAQTLIYGRSTRAYPREACGFLIGLIQNGTVHVIEAFPCRNLATEPDRFEVHPEDFLAAETTARDADRTVVGVWHSHPNQPAVPSARDLEEAYDQWVQLICHVNNEGECSLRCWRTTRGQANEQAICLTD